MKRYRKTDPVSEKKNKTKYNNNMDWNDDIAKTRHFLTKSHNFSQYCNKKMWISKQKTDDFRYSSVRSFYTICEKCVPPNERNSIWKYLICWLSENRIQHIQSHTRFCSFLIIIFFFLPIRSTFIIIATNIKCLWPMNIIFTVSFRSMFLKRFFIFLRFPINMVMLQLMKATSPEPKFLTFIQLSTFQPQSTLEAIKYFMH